MEQSAEGKERLLQKIQKLAVSDRIKLAMRCGAEERTILIKDANKQVMLAVLENPKITEPEIEAVANNRTAPEEALRAISKNREWMKNYSIQLALIRNPKTPPGVSVRFVGSLKKKDLKLLEINRGVSEAVRAAAKKALKMKST
jgi:hypothetical protein